MNSHPQNLLAIVGGTIIDGNGGAPIEDGVILIDAERIISVGDRSMAVPPQAKRIPAAGKYVIPGLMDANVHLYAQHSPAELSRTDGRYEEIITEAAQITLRNGLTTVFDTWGPREALTHVRDQVNRGEIVSSRMFCAGNIIGLGGPTSTDFFPTSRTALSKPAADAIDYRWEQGVGPELLWLTPDEVRARVRNYIHEGEQDFIKFAGSSHTHPPYICFSPEVQRLIIEEAHRAGMVVQAHTTSPESLRMEIEAGADLLQHPDMSGIREIPEEILAVISQRELPCAALFVTRRHLAWSEAHNPEPVRTIYRIKDGNDRRLIAAGARILLTTDSVLFSADMAQNPLMENGAAAEDPPMSLGEAHFLWLQAAAELGMKPMDGLMAATRNIARAYKVDQDVGTLEKGKYADLLVLDRNPLNDPANYRSISVLLKEGRVIDRESLPTRPVLTGPPPAHANERRAKTKPDLEHRP